jgi:hypothetical protein
MSKINSKKFIKIPFQEDGKFMAYLIVVVEILQPQQHRSKTVAHSIGFTTAGLPLLKQGTL